MIEKLFPHYNYENIDGEVNLANFEVYLNENNNLIDCNLVITTYRFHFIPINKLLLKYQPDYYCFPIAITEDYDISFIQENNKQMTYYKLTLKDNRCFVFCFESDKDIHLNDIFKSFVFPNDILYTFSTQYYTHVKGIFI